MNDTQQRFLRIIAERVPVERIVELHLFAPIRQGGTETGVAVFAALTDVQEGERAADAAEAAGAGVEVPGEEQPVEGPPAEAPPAGPPDDAEPDETPMGDPPTDEPPMEAPPMSDPPIGEPAQGTPAALAAAPAIPLSELLEMTPVPADAEEPPTDESENAADVADVADLTDASAEVGDSAEPATSLEAEPLAPATRPQVVRHVVMSARYRLTLKGVDRGKWEVDVVEEADAPLITVDKVVRGVQRRAGDLADVERFTSDTLRQALSETLWATKT